MSKSLSIIDPNDYAVVSDRASEVFSFRKGGLPEQVFAEGFRRFRFLEFDVMLFAEFWRVLVAYAAAFGDQDISVIVHEPEPEHYYRANFARYGAMLFGINCSEEDYKKAWLFEPEGSPADALQYIATTVSWCGSSRRWGFWGERDLGVGITAICDSNMPWPSTNDVKWFDVDDALTSLIAPAYGDGLAPSEFCVKLRNNFSAK